MAGSEISRVITGFEAGMLTRKNAVLKHHYQSTSVQQRFAVHTKALIIAFQKAGNPFDDDKHEVVIIDTRKVMSDHVARMSWVHMETERSSMPILWRIACSLQQSHSTRQSI